MDIRLITAKPAEVETECLIVVALDHGDKQKTEARLAHNDAALDKAAAEVIASGEVTAKALETVLIHRPEGLKAKRLLVVGGGKGKAFGLAERRKAAGAAVRYLKGRMIKTGTLAIPVLAAGEEDAPRAIAEGAIVADFDPDTYRTDRKDQRMKDLTVAAAPGSDQAR